MKCLWIWAGSLSVPSSSCVLLWLNVDCCRCLYHWPLPFSSRRLPLQSAHVIPFINKTLILLHIRVDTVSSQQPAASTEQHLQTSLAVWRRCRMGVGTWHEQFDCPCQLLGVLTNDYHRAQNGSISSHRPASWRRLGQALIDWQCIVFGSDQIEQRVDKLVRIYGIFSEILNLDDHLQFYIL